MKWHLRLMTMKAAKLADMRVRRWRTGLRTFRTILIPVTAFLERQNKIMQNGNDTTRNRIKLIWLFAVFFVLLIVTVSVVIYFIGSQKKAVIDNADSKLSSALTKDEISAIESIFYTRTSGWHTFDQSKKTNIVVRDSTVKTEYPVEDKTFRRVTFLMDADDIKMTYFVTVNLQQGQEIFDSSVTFTCPEPDQMKYPGVFW